MFMNYPEPNKAGSHGTSGVGVVIVLDTGGKGWCPDPVHHKYIARKWTKDLANTHPEYSKDIQNFPSQFN
jgi:hypothetical protein